MTSQISLCGTKSKNIGNHKSEQTKCKIKELAIDSYHQSSNEHPMNAICTIPSILTSSNSIDHFFNFGINLSFQ